MGGGMEFQLSYFKFCKMMLLSIVLNMRANLENTAVATGLVKVSFHFNPKKGNVKECSKYHPVALTSHASNIMIKILQARLQQYVNH